MPKIPIITGPTGSGKTAIALELAEDQPIEIISADSRQIIKDLNIGTAKPSADDQNRVRFHLIDLINAGERYTAFRFVDQALKAIKDILNRKRIPVIVGGTGLYLRALTEGVVEIENEDMAIRERLEKEWESIGAEEMFAKLEALDPLEAVKTHPNNRVRVIRALEIYELTGKTKSELVVTGTYKKHDYQFETFALMPDRAELYESINNRVDQMLEKGWIDEVSRLIDSGQKEPMLKAAVIGYQELIAFLEGHIPLEEAASLIKQSTRRYAKRQTTWLRHQVEAQIFESPKELKTALGGYLAEEYRFEL